MPLSQDLWGIGRRAQAMNLTDLTLHTMAFEVRYAPRYLLFDRAGQFWNEMYREHSTLRMGQIAPNRVAGIIDNQYQLAVELERIVIEDFSNHKRLENFTDLCNDVLSAVVETLEISVFLRVGLRIIYRRTFGSVDDASAFMLKTGLVRVPSGKHFGIEGEARGPVYAIRWEGKALGATANLRTQARRVLMEPPLGERALERVDKELFDFDYDLDYYTMAPVPIGQFRARDWIRQAVHVVERDSRVFLEEKAL
jgi:hypothetical protein